MSTTVTTDDTAVVKEANPGFQLARLREKRGFTKEYVAGKLHLRIKLIELLEADDYEQMPESVFIMGYFRAYAKLLGVSADPFIAAFNSQYAQEAKPDKALWQSRRQSYRGEHLVRWLTALLVLGSLLVVGIWWQKNAGDSGSEGNHSKVTETKADTSKTELTEIAKIRSLFSGKETPVEMQSG